MQTSVERETQVSRELVWSSPRPAFIPSAGTDDRGGNCRAGERTVYLLSESAEWKEHQAWNWKHRLMEAPPRPGDGFRGWQPDCLSLFELAQSYAVLTLVSVW